MDVLVDALVDVMLMFTFLLMLTFRVMSVRPRDVSDSEPALAGCLHVFQLGTGPNTNTRILIKAFPS